MTLSFKEFATQFLRLKLPVKAVDAASAAGFVHRPISLRAVISSAAPYVPAHTAVDDSNNTVPGRGGGPPIVVFSWLDPANSPASGSTPSNPLRRATSWNLTVTEAQITVAETNSFVVLPGVPVINSSVPLKNETAGLVQYDYVYIQLHGEYVYQITAFNDYGSASTGTIPVAIAIPGQTPSISVTYLGTPNSFRIKGTGFTPRAGVKIVVTGGSGFANIVYLTADSSGSINTTQYFQGLCSEAGGGQLQFQATDLGPNTESNTVSQNCH
jgi:hypothetical protein